MHWTELARLEAVGGATLATYERLVEQAHGAAAGSSAHLAKTAFEQAWTEDSERVIAMCEEHAKLSESGNIPEPKPEEPV